MSVYVFSPKLFVLYKCVTQTQSRRRRHQACLGRKQLLSGFSFLTFISTRNIIKSHTKKNSYSGKLLTKKKATCFMW